MRPKGMRRIGQAAVHEGVARQKVAEFVVDDRVRNRKPRQQGEPQPDSQEKDRDAGPVAVLREAETGFARAQFARALDYRFHTLQSSGEGLKFNEWILSDHLARRNKSMQRTCYTRHPD